MVYIANYVYVVQWWKLFATCLLSGAVPKFSLGIDYMVWGTKQL